MELKDLGFEKKINEIKETKTSNGFSKKTFNELTVSYLNDTNNEVKEYSAKGEVTGTHNGALSLRTGLLTNIGKKAGLNADEALQLANDYVINSKEASCFYDITSDLIVGCIQSGKAFTMPRRETMQMSLSLRKKEAGTSIHKSKLGEFKITNKDWDKVICKSTCLDNLKTSERLDV